MVKSDLSDVDLLYYDTDINSSSPCVTQVLTIDSSSYSTVAKSTDSAYISGISDVY